MSETKHNYFSIAFDLLLLGQPLPYDLWINSSTNAVKEKFVRVFPSGGILEDKDIEEFKKYFQLYVHETQRDSYLSSLAMVENAPALQKTEIIRNSAIKYLDKLFDKHKEFTTEVLAEAVEGSRVAVEAMVEVIKDYSVDEVQDLIANLSFHDFYTYDHSINVSMYSITLFKAAKPMASKEEIVMAGISGLLHDLGKIKIPTDIINNPQKLTDEQFEIIKLHPGYGKELLHEHCPSCQGVDFKIIEQAIFEHHENYNGTGYPRKVSGESIHLYARIVAICDFFDAITTKRSYHEVLSTEDALEVMARTAGKKIDPKLFEIFTQNVSNLILKGKTNKELPDDFDPCQPHNVLPFIPVKANIKVKDFFKKEEDNIGKVATNKFNLKRISKKKAS